MLRWPVEPMRAAAVRGLADLPRLQDPRFELKWDGWRAMAWVGRDGVELQSRHGRSLTRYFPSRRLQCLGQPHAARRPPGRRTPGLGRHQRPNLVHAPAKADHRRRGLDREVAARPAHLVLFDVLRDSRGRSLLNEPFDARRRRLERMLRSAPPTLAQCPQTPSAELAESWLSDTGAAGVEGLVVKPAASRYLPGKAGWVKVSPLLHRAHRRRSDEHPDAARVIAARPPGPTRGTAVRRPHSRAHGNSPTRADRTAHSDGLPGRRLWAPMALAAARGLVARSDQPAASALRAGGAGPRRRSRGRRRPRRALGRIPPPINTASTSSRPDPDRHRGREVSSRDIRPTCSEGRG